LNKAVFRLEDFGTSLGDRSIDPPVLGLWALPAVALLFRHDHVGHGGCLTGIHAAIGCFCSSIRAKSSSTAKHNL
jgi:hypothetical protein